MRNFRTDLAMEARALLRQEAAQEIEGVSVQEEDVPGVHITRLTILDAHGEEALGKPIGVYTTLEAEPRMRQDPDSRDHLSDIVCDELKKFMPTPPEGGPCLVTGLGNGGITPDSLGPRTVSEILVTRHVLGYLRSAGEKRMRPVCALAPGVLGTTGIETAEVLRGVTERLHPSCLIAVDALASRSVERIANTIQLTDAGIRPGSGVGGKTAPLDKESLGFPVIAIGIPTVVYASVIARDALRLCLKHETQEVKEEMLDDWIRDRVDPTFGELMVTPRDADVLVEDMAHIIAMGVNLWAHDGLSREEISAYLH